MTLEIRTNSLDSALQMQSIDVLPFNQGGIADKLHSIACTANTPANGVTVQINPSPIQFRSATITSGIPTTRILNTPATCVIPSGATLGTVSGVASRIIVLALDFAGVVECAVVNLAGGTSLDETGLISTTAISAGSSSASVVYSTNARTNVAYRVLGAFDSTQTVAGTWASAVSLVVSAGGNALTAMSSLGYGQNWQNVIGSRSLSTTYYNTTNKPILVSTCGYWSTTIGMRSTVNGVSAAYTNAAANISNSLYFIVPAGGSYVLTGGYSLTDWSELR